MGTGLKDMGAGQLVRQQYMWTGTTVILLTRDWDNSVMQVTRQQDNRYEPGSTTTAAQTIDAGQGQPFL
jgi:hypothetical protein